MGGRDARTKHARAHGQCTTQRAQGGAPMGNAHPSCIMHHGWATGGRRHGPRRPHERAAATRERPQGREGHTTSTATREGHRTGHTAGQGRATQKGMKANWDGPRGRRTRHPIATKPQLNLIGTRRSHRLPASPQAAALLDWWVAPRWVASRVSSSRLLDWCLLASPQAGGFSLLFPRVSV